MYRHANRGGSQECPSCGACKELIEDIYSECAFCNCQCQLKCLLASRSFSVQDFRYGKMSIFLLSSWEI